MPFYKVETVYRESNRLELAIFSAVSTRSLMPEGREMRRRSEDSSAVGVDEGGEEGGGGGGRECECHRGASEKMDGRTELGRWLLVGTEEALGSPEDCQCHRSECWLPIRK